MGEIRDLLIKLLIFSAVVIGISTFYAGLYDTYSVTSYESLSFINATNETLQITEDLKDSIEATQITGVSLIDYPLTVAAGVYNTLRLTISSIDIYTSLITDLTHQIVGIPSWFASIIIGIITLIVVFGIAGAITKTRV